MRAVAAADAECTKPCLPKCVDERKPTSVAALAAAAEAHAAAKGKALAKPVSYPPHTAVPVEAIENELDSSAL